MSTHAIDLTSQRFGRLAVLQRAEPGKHGQSRWECVCLCGNVTVAWALSLKSGNTRSCGCLRKETASKAFTTHGLSRTPEHKAWMAARQRILNPKCREYKHYGGRGLTMSPEWLGEGGFERFLAHIGPRTDVDLSIDRIDNSKGYWPGNVRWADKRTQANNRRSHAA